MTSTLKLDSGLQHLEDWADTASQTEKNHLYKALFAVSGRTVHHHYGVLTDKENRNAHFVLVREDLVLKVNYSDQDTFDIAYIGSMAGAPGFDLALQAH